jgi:hypothetical protein
MNAWAVPGYREERELGAGGAGRVVLATYTGTGAHVAIKYLSERLRHDPAFLAGFRAEARVMVELNDPNIVRLYEYIETMAGAAIVMELVDGVSLRRLLAEHGSTSPEAALVVLKGSLAGMSTAHSMGIVHRDYKPENVLVQADGTTKLTDFGIFARAGETGQRAGTPPYMAPEQWDGSPAGPATDVYAAACVFFECLTGHRPYRADHELALKHQHQTAPIPVLEVPGSVRELIARGLAKNPGDRPPTARSFVAELEMAAISAYGPEWEQRGRRHLAELATLLALLFPLADPPPLQVGTSLARTRLGQRRRGRAPHVKPRLAIGAGVLSVAVVVAAVLSANRGSTELGGTTTLTTPERSHVAAQPPPKAPKVKATAKPSKTPGAGLPAIATRGPAADSAKSPPRSPAGHTPATSSATKTTTPPTTKPPTTAPPTTAPPTTQPPTTAPPVLAVNDLRIADFDGNRAAIAVVTTTPQQVLLSVRFAQGSSPDRLTEGPAQTVPLTGRTRYVAFQTAGFSPPECGQTVYRQVTVSTTPRAPGRERSRTIKVQGPECPPPTVKSLSIGSWDGRRGLVDVETDGAGPVVLTARFSRKDAEVGGKVLDSATRTLSGRTRYDNVALAGDLGQVACGKVGFFIIQVTSEPAAPAQPVTKGIRIPGPKCEPPVIRILSWNGNSVRVRIRTSTVDPVTVSASFLQKVTNNGDTTRHTDAGAVDVAGATSYVRTLSTGFASPKCGDADSRTVTVITSPASSNGAQFRSVTLTTTPCAPPPSDPPSDPPSNPPSDGGGTRDGVPSSQPG